MMKHFTRTVAQKISKLLRTGGKQTGPGEGMTRKQIAILFGCLFLLVSCRDNQPTITYPTVIVDTGILPTSSPPPSQTPYLVYLPTITAESTTGISPDENSCTQSSFGTMLLNMNPDDWISPTDVMLFANAQVGIKGMVAAGAPSEAVKNQSFSRLPGWTRSFIRGNYDQLLSIHSAASIFGMQDMYECIAYGPESMHSAGSEALEPLLWVPKAKEVAESTGKCLIYGPAVQDYESMSTLVAESHPDETLLAQRIAEVAPYVDIWMIQVAKYQRWTDAGKDDSGTPFSMDDFSAWIRWWVDQIKTSNPQAEVWTQLGIGVYDPINKTCLPPQPPEYLLNYREEMVKAGVDGVFVAPSQSCMVSSDPQDHEFYLQSLNVMKQAIELACTNQP